MRILLIAYYYPPVHTGGTDRPHRMAKYLPGLGHPVEVVTHGAERDHWNEPGVIRIWDPSYNKHRTTLRRKAIWLARRLYIEALNTGGIYRSIYSPWLRRVVSLKQEILDRTKPDVILATYPPVETLEAGLSFSREAGIPLIVDFRDGLFFEPNESKRMERHACIRDYYSRLERDAVEAARCVLTVNEPIAGYFRERYPGATVEIIANGFDPADFAGLKPEPLEPGCFHIAHAGRFSLSHAPINPAGFFDAIRRLLKRSPEAAGRIRIHLMGELVPSELASLSDLQKQGVIRYYGMIPRRRCLEIQQSADLLMIVAHGERVSAQTAKIFEYIYSRRPILALANPKSALADMVRRSRTGWILHPSDSSGVEKALEKLLMAARSTEVPPFNPDNGEIERYSFFEQLNRLAHLLEKSFPTG